MTDAKLCDLVSYLNRHSVGTAPTVRGVTADGRLVVASAWAHATTGAVGESIEVIDATISAAREWLGY